jgi:hypothetical protein
LNTWPVSTYPAQFEDPTVRSAGAVVAVPAELVNAASYSDPFSENCVVNEYVVDVAPEMAVHVPPLLADDIHCTFGVGEPAAAAENDTVDPSPTTAFAGPLVITGALVTVSMAGFDCTEPEAFEKSARNSSPASVLKAVKA